MEAATPVVSISIENRLEEVGRVADLLDAFGREHGVPQAVLNDMHVAVDEAVSNVVRHAYADDVVHRIGVFLERAPERLSVRVEDDGVEFDPLAVHIEPAGGALGQRPVGGLGLLFMRRLMDEIAYRRIDGRNELTLRKRIVPGAATPAGAAGEGGAAEHASPVVVDVCGRVDSSTAPALHQRLKALAESPGARIIVNLVGADYLTSAGFWAILAAARIARARHGDLVLCGVGKDLGRLFDAGGFTSLFRIHADADSAIREFTHERG
jgi:serine/threonine-protein kinase RsbW